MINEKIRPLYDRERDAAWEQAKKKVVGPDLDPTAFKVARPSKYPTSILILVVILCLMVLVAAFIPSAYRLYAAGENTFCYHGGYSEAQCRNVGLATVVLAETGQLVFFFALAVLGDTQRARRIFWASILLSTSIALVGNLAEGKPWEQSGIVFGFIETISPPLLVMSIGYVLKDLMLISIERRHQFNLEFDQAILTQQKIEAKPESAGDTWLSAYSITLRNAIRKAHAKQKEAVAALSTDEWRYLIKQEMLAGQWTVNPVELTRIEKAQLKEQWYTTDQEEDDAAPTTTDTGDVVWQDVDGQWMSKSGVSGKTFGGYKYRGYATNALKNHHRALSKKANK